MSRRRFVWTTSGDPTLRAAPDLAKRVVAGDELNRLWATEVTDIPTWTGLLCLAAVLDAWGRRALGWAKATYLRTGLVVDVLNVVVTHRRRWRMSHHSGRDCQETVPDFGFRYQAAGVPN